MTSAEWSAGLTTYLERIVPAVGDVIVLAPPPSSMNVQNCYTPQSAPADCMTKVTEQWLATSRTEASVADTLGATYVDSRDLFCVSGYCPAFVGTVPVKLDLVHITSDYATKVAPALLELLSTSPAA